LLPYRNGAYDNLGIIVMDSAALIAYVAGKLVIRRYGKYNGMSALRTEFHPGRVWVNGLRVMIKNTGTS
jgi:hypothetical protein